MCTGSKRERRSPATASTSTPAGSTTETQHHSIGLAEDAGAFDRLLLEILATIGWRGEHRRLFEALPHMQQIGSFTMLRTVLDRLDVSLIKVERHGRQLSARDLPYLIVDNDSCWLVRSVGGKAQAYNAAAPSESVDAGSLRGSVFLLRSNKADDAPVWTPVDGFVGTVVRALRKQITRIAAYSAAISALGIGLSLYILLVYDLVIATGSRDTLVYLAAGAAAALALELYLYIQRSKRIAYIASRFDGIVQVRALAAVINLPLALTERAPLASQLARFRQFELGRELFAGTPRRCPARSALHAPVPRDAVRDRRLVGIRAAGYRSRHDCACGLLRAGAPWLIRRRLPPAGLRWKPCCWSSPPRLALCEALPRSEVACALGRKLAIYERTRFESMRQVPFSRSQPTYYSSCGRCHSWRRRAAGDGGTLSLGGLVACMIIVWRMLLPVQIVSLNLPRLRQIRTTVRQIDDLMRMRPERDDAIPMVFRRLRGTISTSGLYLNLGTRQEPQLQRGQYRHQAGEIVLRYWAQWQREVDANQGAARDFTRNTSALCALAATTCASSIRTKFVRQSAMGRTA